MVSGPEQRGPKTSGNGIGPWPLARLAAVLGLCAGCSHAAASNYPPGGPVSIGSNTGTTCIPASVTTSTLGILAIVNSAGTVATITGVQLVQPTGYRLMGADVLALPAGHPLVGAQPGYPPTALGGGVRWSQSRSAAGYTIPAHNRQTLNLILGLTNSPGTVHQANGVELDYTVGGRAYQTRSSIGITTTTGRCP